MSSYQREREALGDRLRELRRDARLTGQQLAEPNGWHQSKVSRIEAGKQTPSDNDIRSWTQTCGALDEAPDLIAALRTLEGHYRQFRRQFRAGMARYQREYRDLEAETTRLRNFESVFIPGLLQTPAYAHHRLSQIVLYSGAADDVAAAVAARMERQQVLYRSDKRFHIVLTEAALRFRLCPPSILIGQLDRLISATTIPNLRLGVLPFEIEYTTPPTHGFWIFDDTIVRVETFAADLHISEPTEIELYLRVFDHLAKSAVYGNTARELMLRVQADLSRDVR